MTRAAKLCASFVCVAAVACSDGIDRTQGVVSTVADDGPKPTIRTRRPSLRTQMRRAQLAARRDAAIGVVETAGANDTIVVGSATLKRCSKKVSYFCGTLTRPLDPSGHVPGTIDIHYEWYPHTNPTPAAGTIVAIEGGPGFGSTESRDFYLETFAPLFGDRDMVLVDARGTGLSAPIDCPAAQTDGILTQADIAACGATLGHTSDLYGSDMAAADMEAILETLDVGLIDLYGDSYGTYSSQIFAGNYPQRIRTLTLDAAYPVLNADPFFAPEGDGLRTTFDNVCSRSPDCSGTTNRQVERVVAALRAHPAGAAQVIRGGQPGPMNPSDLGYVENITAEEYIMYSEYDPSLRAYLAGDPVPLVRLVNEAWLNEEGGVGLAPADFSLGGLIAVTCQDGPMAYDMTLPPGPRRQATYNASIAALQRTNPDVYAPFSIPEWLATPLDWSITGICLNWPVSSPAHPEGRPVPSGRMPDVPTLVLTGDLDTVTPVGEGDQVAAEFSHVKRVIVKNGVHVTALGDFTGCIEGFVDDFILAGTTRGLKTDCAATATPPFRLVPSFATTVGDVSLRGVKGHGASAANQRIARAAVLTANDSLTRMWNLGVDSGAGLRGGTFRSNAAFTKVTLKKTFWTSDLGASGTVSVADDSVTITATLTLHGVASGSITATWEGPPGLVVGEQGLATVTGTINGSAVNIEVPAP